MDVSARFVEEKDRERLKNPAYATEPYPFGRVYYLPGSLVFQRQLKFGLVGLFGFHSLRCAGVAPVNTSPLD